MGIFGSWLLSYGRVLHLKLSIILGIVGIIIECFPFHITIGVGRLVFGASTGLIQYGIMKYFEETIP